LVADTDSGLIPGETGRLTVGRKISLTLTWRVLYIFFLPFMLFLVFHFLFFYLSISSCCPPLSPRKPAMVRAVSSDAHSRKTTASAWGNLNTTKGVAVPE
jgi:hypothetical protein